MQKKIDRFVPNLKQCYTAALQNRIPVLNCVLLLHSNHHKYRSRGSAILSVLPFPIYTIAPLYPLKGHIPVRVMMYFVVSNQSVMTYCIYRDRSWISGGKREPFPVTITTSCFASTVCTVR